MPYHRDMLKTVVAMAGLAGLLAAPKGTAEDDPDVRQTIADTKAACGVDIKFEADASLPSTGKDRADDVYDCVDGSFFALTTQCKANPAAKKAIADAVRTVRCRLDAKESEGFVSFSGGVLLYRIGQPGDFEQANAAWLARTFGRSPAEQAFAAAETALRENRRDEAIAGFKRALELDPSLGWAWVGIASAWSGKQTSEDCDRAQEAEKKWSSLPADAQNRPPVSTELERANRALQHANVSVFLAACWV
jgi:tetratricopeptide (TPR) repeat protein